MTERPCEALRVFADETALDPAAEARVRRRLDHPVARRSARWVAPLFVATAVAALAALALRPAPVVPLDAPLATTAGPVALAGLVGVTARIDGAGTLGGTSASPIVRWEEGWIELEVDPDAGPDLVVTTEDARVVVTGTVFRVERDVLGTDVSVTRGTVEVTCGGGEVHRVAAGGHLECLPTTAAGLLARARAQARAEASADEVLATVDEALRTAEEPVGTELRFLRVEELARAGRSADALAAADAFLASGATLRRDDVARIGLRTALAAEDCARARTFLDALTADGGATRDDQDLLRGCRARRRE